MKEEIQEMLSLLKNLKTQKKIIDRHRWLAIDSLSAILQEWMVEDIERGKENLIENEGGVK